MAALDPGLGAQVFEVEPDLSGAAFGLQCLHPVRLDVAAKGFDQYIARFDGGRWRIGLLARPRVHAQARQLALALQRTGGHPSQG